MSKPTDKETPVAGIAPLEKATRESVTTLNRSAVNYAVSVTDGVIKACRQMPYSDTWVELNPAYYDDWVEFGAYCARDYVPVQHSLDGVSGFRLFSEWSKKAFANADDEYLKQIFDSLRVKDDPWTTASTLHPTPMFVIERVGSGTEARYNFILQGEKHAMALNANDYHERLVAAQQIKFSKTLPLDDDGRYSLWCAWMVQSDQLPDDPVKAKSLWDSYRDPSNQILLNTLYSEYLKLCGASEIAANTSMQMATQPYQLEALRRLAESGSKRMAESGSKRMAESGSKRMVVQEFEHLELDRYEVVHEPCNDHRPDYAIRDTEGKKPQDTTIGYVWEEEHAKRIVDLLNEFGMSTNQD